MAVEDVYKETEAKMNKAMESTRNDFASIRTGRASPALLDRITVEAYGAHVPLKQVASVSSPDGRSLLIAAFDKSQVGAIRKAIETSDLGLNPNVDGQNVRLSIPPLTEERRKELVKKLHGVAEDHRVSLRNVRRDANEQVRKLLKDKLISEDEERRALDEVQKMTDGYIQKLDQAAKGKEKEILEIR